MCSENDKQIYIYDSHQEFKVIGSLNLNNNLAKKLSWIRCDEKSTRLYVLVQNEKGTYSSFFRYDLSNNLRSEFSLKARDGLLNHVKQSIN
jgi:hypothetical protein